jgi:putative selenium metabolism protein SsnA
VSDRSDPVTLLGNGVVVTGGEPSAVVLDGAVAWSGERVIGVGPASDVMLEFPDAGYLDAAGGLIMPGFINLHNHLYSALARGLVPVETPTNFGQILDRMWWRLDRALTPRTVHLSALLGAAECIRWGCTTIFDHHASPSCLRGSLDMIADALEEARLSALLCYEVSDRNGRDEAVAGLVENLHFIDRHRAHPRIRGTLGLHASFTLSDATLDEVAERRPPDCGIHVHLAEDELDSQASKLAFGAAPVDRFASRGLLDERALLIHGVHLDSERLAVLARHGAILVHCPESNFNNAVGRLDVERAAAEGCLVGLGTDGMSSALLRALRFAFLVERGGRQDPTAGFTVHPRLLRNNVSAARRFFDEPLLGELTVGAPADICVVDCPPPTPIDASNLFGHLVYGAAEAPVRHTVARGEILLEDFRHTSLDIQAIAEHTRAEAPGLWERFGTIGESAVD